MQKTTITIKDKTQLNRIFEIELDGVHKDIDDKVYKELFKKEQVNYATMQMEGIRNFDDYKKAILKRFELTIMKGR